MSGPALNPRYTDSTAVDETLYDALQDGLELARQRTVQAVSLDRPVPVGDHGQVFPGAGFGDSSLKEVDRPLRESGSGSSALTRRLQRAAPGLRVEQRH